MAWTPSKEFFEALRTRINADSDRPRRLGTVDMTLVVKIDYADKSDYYEIRFSGYRCTGVRQLKSSIEADKGAVVVSGPYEVWREMFDNITSKGAADLAHTLNTLTLLDTPLLMQADNQLDADLFYRYQQNLQEFFDGAAQSSGRDRRSASAGAA